MNTKLLLTVVCTVLVFGTRPLAAQTVDLPTSKQLIGEIPGHPQRLNSLPISMAVSPDGRYVVTVNAGYGTYESQLRAVAGGAGYADGRAGGFSRCPHAGAARQADALLGLGLQPRRQPHLREHGLADRPARQRQGQDRQRRWWCTASSAGKIAPERLIPLPLQQLAPGHKTKLIGEREGDKGVPFPAAIAVVAAGGREKLLVAENLSDDVLLLDAATRRDRKTLRSLGERCRAVDLPCRAAVSRKMARAPLSRCGMRRRSSNWIWPRATVAASWHCSSRRTRLEPGTHPCALALSPDGKTLYVALANRDAVAAVNVGGEASSP